MSQLSKVLRDRFEDAKTLINTRFRIDSFLGQQGIHVENNRQIRCPFHDDSTPSFSVDTESNIWKCFGCPDGGHFLDIWIKYNNRYNSTNYSIFTATEQLLSQSPELQAELGFSSIFQNVEQQFDLFSSESTEGQTAQPAMSTSFFDQKLARPSMIQKVPTDSMHSVLQKLHTAGIDAVLSFIADCERGFTEQQLISKYYRNQGDIDSYIYKLTNSNKETEQVDNNECYTAFMEALNT